MIAISVFAEGRRSPGGRHTVGASLSLGLLICETGSSQYQPNRAVGRNQEVAKEESALHTVGGQ